MSSMYVGMYRCIRKYGVSGWLVILFICKYGEITSVVGILVILLGWCFCKSMYCVFLGVFVGGLVEV
jgi:hypothetical protein